MNIANDKCVLGVLVYLNEKNYEDRRDMVLSSLSSLNLTLSQKNLIPLVINNGGTQIADSIIKSVLNVQYDYAFLDKNFFDVSVHMCSYWHALKTGSAYFAYSYDDFVFFDHNWIDDSIQFMNVNNNVSCMRIPKYVHGDKYFDTRNTSKSINPDSVRHEDGAGGARLVMINSDSCNEGIYGSHNFYFSNWRPNSRPTLWRTQAFSKLIQDRSEIPVMQSFEKLMYDYADSNALNWVSGFLNQGVCSTFSVETSERTKVSNHYRDVIINVNELRDSYEEGLT